MSRFAWLKKRKKTDPEMPLRPPIWTGNRSNGEYFDPQSPRDRLMHRLVLEEAETQSRKLGMDRREFLASSMGMATTLAVINQLGGCSDDGSARNDDAGMDGKQPLGGSPFLIPEAAMCEETGVLEGDEFIFDLQTHSFDDGEWREKNMIYASIVAELAFCGEPDKLDCFDRKHYAEEIFVDSDTTVAVITSWPAVTCTEDRQIACGLPLSNDGMRDLRDWFNEEAMSQRVVNQVQVMPNDRIEVQKEIMQQAAEDKEWGLVGWKAYPAWISDTYKPDGKPSAYFLTDDIGKEFIEYGLSLGIPNFAIHKGLPQPGFDVEHNLPSDIGPTAKDYPDANLIVYHSAIGANGMSGSNRARETKPFDPEADEHFGLDTLIKSLLDNDVGPGSNVYAELGTAWWSVMSDAVAAQHFIGKLLKYVGEDNIVWGTDSLLTGSPQGQIEAFRMFSISEQFQNDYGYPPLTDEARRKIFGLNGARFHRIDPELERCRVERTQFASVKRFVDGEFGPRRWAVKAPGGPRTRREFLALAERNRRMRTPG